MPMERFDAQIIYTIGRSLRAVMSCQMSGRIHSIDYMRMVLAAFVVIGHSGLGRQTVDLAGLMLGNTVLRSAVPLFAMTAGFLLFRTMGRGRLWGWVRQLVILYLLWTGIYYFALEEWRIGLRGSLYEVVFGFQHLWFLEALAIAAVMLAGISRRSRQAVIWTAAGFGTVGLVLQYLDYARLVALPLELYRSGPLFIYPFLALGYLFAVSLNEPQSLPWNFPTQRRLAWLGLTGLALSIVENLLCLLFLGPYALLEFPLGMFLMAPAVFGLALYVRAPQPSWPLAQISAAIYVGHYLILHIAHKLHFDHPLGPALLAYVLPALYMAALMKLRDRQARVIQPF